MTESGFPRCWVYDENNRVYRRNEQGRAFGSPMQIGYWREVQIVGESRTHWHTNRLDFQKIPKAGGPKVAFTWEEVQRRVWVAENRHRLAETVRQVEEYEKLRAIAAIVDYQEQSGC